MEQASALVLDISGQDNTLAMSIFDQREIDHTVRHYSQLEVSFAQIHKLCREITLILNKATAKGILEPEAIRGLEKSSQILWDHLLTRPVKDRLKSTAIKNLVLSLDERLIDIPWELLYDGNDFLCLKFNLGRLVKTKAEQAAVQYRSLTVAPKMLILANPTGDLKSAYQEGVYIKNQFDRRRTDISINFKSTSIDTLYVKKNLRDYDIVHFAGHCEYDTDNPQNTGWVFNDARFGAQDIIALAESAPLPSLIFSNACYSAKTGPDLLKADYREKNYSLAASLLFSGVRHYIGTTRRVEDQMSLLFAQEFYTRLIKGASVGECMRLSRLKLIKEYGIGAISWAGYLLYGNPNFILFRPKPKAQAIKWKRKLSLSKKQMLKVIIAGLALSIFIYLYMWLPSLNPSTYLLLLKSRRLFAQGMNHEVVSLSNRIIQKEPQFLAVYPLLADSLHKLGKSELALKYYFEYSRYSEKRKEVKHLISAYLGIGWVYQLKGDYPKAEDFYNQALALSKENKDMLSQAAALRRLAEWHIDRKEYDQALELLTRTSDINRERQRILGHRYNLACDYFDIGLVFTNKGDFATAREFYEKSRILFQRLRLENELSDCYFNLGETYFYEKQYQKALDSYLEGLKIDQLHNNKLSIASDYIMLGELYLEMDNLGEAEKFFQQSVLISKQINAPVELASAYYNLGLLYKQQGKRDEAIGYLREAEKLYQNIDTPDYQEVKQELADLLNSQSN